MRKMSKWADIIYVADTYSVGYFAYLIKKLTGKKYIIRFAGDSAWEMSVSRGWTEDYISEFVNKKYNKKIEKLKARRKKIMVNADAIIAVSDFIAGIAEDIGVKKERIKIIYNSIDFVNFGKVDKELSQKVKNRYKQNSLIIATACRLTRWKGVDGIIRVLPRLMRALGNIDLLVLGEGPEKKNLENLAKRIGIFDNVHFLGKIEHKDMLGYLGSADLFVLNTNYEALSHAILEAMKARVPIVATDIGGNPEVIENGKEGLLVGYNDQSALLKAILKILKDYSLAEKFLVNAEKKLEKFNWENNIKNTADFMKKIYYE